MSDPARAMFAPADLPPRDAYGHVIHPDMPSYADDEPCGPRLRSLGFDLLGLGLPDIESLRFEAQDTPDCSWWSPEPPPGEHWRLAGITDSEDGPWALFVRPYSLSPRQPLVSWVVYDRPLDFPDTAIAREWHDDNPTSTHILGDTVADVLAQLPPGLSKLPRNKSDHSSVIGTWL